MRIEPRLETLFMLVLAAGLACCFPGKTARGSTPLDEKYLGLSDGMNVFIYDNLARALQGDYTDRLLFLNESLNRMHGQYIAGPLTGGATKMNIHVARWDNLVWDGQGTWADTKDFSYMEFFESGIDFNFMDPYPFLYPCIVLDMQWAIFYQANYPLDWNTDSISEDRFPSGPDELPAGKYSYLIFCWRKWITNESSRDTLHVIYDYLPPQFEYLSIADGKVYPNLPAFTGRFYDPYAYMTNSAGSWPTFSGVQEMFCSVSYTPSVVGDLQALSTISHLSFAPPGGEAEAGGWGGSCTDCQARVNFTVPITYTNPGWYEVKFYGRDRADNMSSNFTLTVGLDTGDPSRVAITYPEVGPLYGNVIRITGEAQDDALGLGIDNVCLRLIRDADGYFWNGGGWGPGTHSWNTRRVYPSSSIGQSGTRRPKDDIYYWLSDWRDNLPTAAQLYSGTYTIEATAYDRAGRYRTVTQPFSVEADCLVMNFVSPSNGAAATTTIPPITGNARLGGANILTSVDLYLSFKTNDWEGHEVDWYWDGADWDSEHVQSVPGTIAGTNWSYTGTLPTGAKLHEGHYMLLAYGRDSGHMTNWITQHIYIDRTPPLAPTITAPAAGSIVRTLPTIMGTAQDTATGSGIASVSLWLRRDMVSEWFYWNPTSRTWQASEEYLMRAGVGETNWVCADSLPSWSGELPSGSYQVFASATDRAGWHTDAAAPVSFKVYATNLNVTLLTITNYSHHLTFPTPGGRVGGVHTSDSLKEVNYYVRRNSDLADWNGSEWIPGFSEQTGTIEQATQWVGNVTLPTGTNALPGKYHFEVSAQDHIGNAGKGWVIFYLDAPNPEPVLDATDPDHSASQAQSVTLQLTGTNFILGSKVLWNGAAYSALYCSSTQLVFAIPTNELIAWPAEHEIAVSNPPPGGGVSAALVFRVDPPVPVAPENDNYAERTPFYGAPMHATNTGSNAGASIETGEPLPLPSQTPARSVWWSWGATNNGLVTISTEGSDFDTVLAAYSFEEDTISNLTLIAANDDAHGGKTSEISFYPTWGGAVICVDGFNGATGQVVLSINQEFGTNPPVITRLDPPYAIVRGEEEDGVLINVHGGIFDENAQVLWNGSDEILTTTTWVNRNLLYVGIYPEYMRNPTQGMITVYNLDQYGERLTSQEVLFEILAEPPLAPVLNSIFPDRVNAEISTLPLTLHGSGFFNGCQVLWNNHGYTPTSWSATQLVWNVPFSLYQWQVKNVSIAVSNPPPYGGVSSAQTLAFRQGSPQLNIEDYWMEGSGMQLHLRVSGPSGLWHLQRSYNLFDWETIATNDGTYGFTDFSDPDLETTPCFYRSSMPSP